MGRIVLLGATGYTGRLIADRLAKGSVPFVLAGRSADALAALAGELGGAETALFSLDDATTIRRLLGPGDVLLTTVGSFITYGDVAVRAAVESGAHYLDSTGEVPFIRGVFETTGDARGAMVPAMAFNYAPGNLAGALALEAAGERADRVDLGYFLTGEGAQELSRGTVASIATVLMSRCFTWHEGLHDERCGARTRSFSVGGKRMPAMTLGASECLTLPRIYPRIRVVDGYQGGVGAATPVVAQVSRLAAVPGAAALLKKANAAVARRLPDGPDAATRASAGTHVVAIASSREGHVLAEVTLRGPNVYDTTADLLAWAATKAASGEISGRGPLGPVEAFGLDGLRACCDAAGFTTTESR
jgi:short subunit dehydrogenase-like uncharacterized protein